MGNNLLFYIRRNKENRILEKATRRKAKRKSNHTQVVISPNYVAVRTNSAIIAPDNISFSESPDSTSSFINIMIERAYYEHHRADGKEVIVLDFHSVTSISSGFIVYLIATINILKIKYSVSFSAIPPSSLKIKRKMEQPGFFDILDGCNLLESDSNSPLSVYFGVKYNTLVAKNVCERVIDAYGIERKSISFLYQTIIELMENTKAHAYSEDDICKYWYLYVATRDNGTIRFSIVDTGEGIPETVRKNWFEPLTRIIGVKKDSELIESALLGENRSETGKYFRGKGLPKIRSCCESLRINNLTIVSGRGVCYITDGKIALKELKERFVGTVVTWDITIGGS